MASPGMFGVIIKSNRVHEVTARVSEQLSLAVDRAAKNIEARAKAGAPVDTGFLRNSIVSKMTGLHTAEVNVGAEYGAYVNFGTRHTSPRPFMTDAVEKERPRFIADVSNIEQSLR